MGAFTCTDGTTTVTTELEENSGACTAGELTLDPDGTVGGASGATWSGNSSEFQICTGGDCLVCTPAAGSPPDGGTVPPEMGTPTLPQTSRPPSWLPIRPTAA